jgi:probable O-glycosylation ligase (exosortase A-associated)
MLRMTFVLIILVAGAILSLASTFYALLFYIWYAYFRPDYWTYGPFIMSLNMSLMIGIYISIRAPLTVQTWVMNFRVLLIVAFFLQCAVATVTSENQFASRMYLADFCKVLLITYFIIVLVDDRKNFRLTLIVMALSLGLECAKQGWINLYRQPGARNDNPIAFLGDNNGVALGTMMLMPIFGALMATARHKWEKLWWQFLAIGVFLRGFTTYSRGGFVAAAVLGLLTLARSPRKVKALLSVVAIVVLVRVVMPQEFWDRMDTIFVNEEGQRDDSSASRLYFWGIAMDMVRAKPLTGVGLNAFLTSYWAYNPAGLFSGDRQSHSTWFGLLAELGYPGFVIFVLNLGLAIAASWRVHRIARKSADMKDLRAYANALITSFFVFIAGGTFLTSQYNEMLWHFTGMATALLIITRRLLREAPPTVETAPVPLALARAASGWR